MAKFNLCVIRPKGFLHANGFTEIRDSVAWALASLGHDTMLTDNSFSSGAATNIIFGCELLSPTSPLPPNAIVFQLEQPEHPNMRNVQHLAKGHRIWDYNAANVRRWLADGYDAVHVPIGYTPNLTRIPKAATQDIDVLFHGWFTPRRLKIIADLRAAGLNVVALDQCYGGGRDNLISRAKVCLNVNHDGRTLFNILRCSFWMANSKCIVSEESSDIADYMPQLDGAMTWWKYESLVAQCVDLVNHLGTRMVYESEGFRKFSAMDYAASIAAALDNVEPHYEPKSYGITVEVNPIKARYEAGLQSGDMTAFLPYLRDHAAGRILEIGTRDGASTSAFLLGLEAHGGHLTSIDIDDCSGLWQHPQWTFIKASSLAMRFPDDSFDIALIDGNHSREAVIGDLYNCWHWVRPGGLILVHDIVPERGHEFYSIAIREEYFKFIAAHNCPHEELPGPYGLGVLTVTR
jgi:SAM-dependent methyltransferase